MAQKNINGDLNIEGTLMQNGVDVRPMTEAEVESVFKYGFIVSDILQNNSWDAIRRACEIGIASELWSVGDTKTDVGTDGITRTFRICDMQGLYGKHVVFEQVDIEAGNAVSWNVSTNKDDEGYWADYAITNVEGCIRHTLNNVIKAKYSTELQTALTPTTFKVAKHGISPITILEVTDYLFVAAEKEIFGSVTYSPTEEGAVLTQYEYYVAHGSDSDRIKKQSNTARRWWLRSPRLGTTACTVSEQGKVGWTGNKEYVSAFFAF